MSENPIKVTDAGVTLTGDGIIFFQRSAALRGLAVEIVTGMTLSRNGSGLDACRAQGLLEPGKRTTRKAGLRNAVKAMQLLYPTWEVSPSIRKALDNKK